MAELITTSLFNDANLQAYWRFEGNSNDSKGSNNGTDTSITYNSTNAEFGQSANFVTANSSKIALTPASALEPTGKFSVTAWIKTTNGAADCGFLESLAQGATLAGFLCGLSSGKARFLIGKNTGLTVGTDYNDISSSASINDANMHFVAWVYDTSTMKIYIDNVLDTNQNKTISAVYSSPVCRIGCQGETGTDAHFYGGSIDDLALFNRDLSAAEINILFIAGGGMTPNSKYWGT